MFDFDLVDLGFDSDVVECSVCFGVSIPRECRSCGMDTCAMCVECEYCA